MRRLVIDTTSDNMSLALFDADQLIAADHRRMARGHAELLIPAIAAMPDGGRAATIWIGCGPGSFTGTRVGLAAARALAFAWGARLEGYDSLALVAAQAWRLSGERDVTVVCEGGHGQWLVAEAPMRWRALDPADAVLASGRAVIAGNCAAEYVALRGWGTAIAAEVDARETCAMAPDARFVDVRALYARPPDAKPAKVTAP